MTSSPLMTVSMVAKRLNLKDETVREMARKQRIPMFKIARTGDWRIEEEQFLQWVRTQRPVHG